MSFARSYRIKTTVKKEIGPKTASALLPSQVAKAYNFPDVSKLDLSKRSIAILELGGAFQLSDVISYCNRFGYKVPNITTHVLPGGAEVSDPNGADGEVCLDIDVIAAIAQGVHIHVVFAPNTNAGFPDGLQYCADLGVDVTSVSWGGPVDSWDQPTKDRCDAIMQKAANEKGMAFYCASGDNGSSDGSQFGNRTDYPACSPYAISCGGTHLELNEDGTRANESAWSVTGKQIGNINIGSNEGGGGGIDASYPTPHWQAGILTSEPVGRREPDISGNADPETGYQVDINGTIQQIGGTSAVAPLYSALQCIINALKGEHVGNIHTKLYDAYTATHDSFFDVTVGNNGGYKSGTGFDLVTGCGVLNAEAFIATLK